MKTPLVHFITNYVTANDLANTTLAFGGKPLMAEEVDELSDITSMADVLVINTGTIKKSTLQSIKKACGIANQKGIPIVLDPVGVSASSFRKEGCMELLSHYTFQVIKGNLAEIKALLHMSGQSIGIDSLEEINDETPELAKSLASKYQCVVAITGTQDIIAFKDSYATVNSGTEKLTLITGTGCMIAAIIGVYLGKGHSLLDATLYGVGAMSLSGMLAEKELQPNEGLGTYKVKLFDQFTHMTTKLIDQKGMINRYGFKTTLSSDGPSNTL